MWRSPGSPSSSSVFKMLKMTFSGVSPHLGARTPPPSPTHTGRYEGCLWVLVSGKEPGKPSQRSKVSSPRGGEGRGGGGSRDFHRVPRSNTPRISLQYSTSSRKCTAHHSPICGHADVIIEVPVTTLDFFGDQQKRLQLLSQGLVELAFR